MEEIEEELTVMMLSELQQKQSVEVHAVHTVLEGFPVSLINSYHTPTLVLYFSFVLTFHPHHLFHVSRDKLELW